MGDHFKSAVITVRKSGRRRQEHRLPSATSTSPNFRARDGNGVLPMESLSLNYAQMVQEQEQKADGSLGGSVKLGYDWAKQEKK